MKNFGFLLFLGIGFLTQAQTITSTIAEPSRWTFGGGAGVGISSGNGRTGTSINIIPRIGYRLTEDLEAGVAGSFTWANSKYFSTTMLGVGPFANYYFSRSFYISGNFQQYFVDQKDKIYNEKYNKDESALYLGAGYMQSIGNRAYMQMGIMYNVLYKENSSVFSSGFIPSIGVVVGL